MSIWNEVIFSSDEKTLAIAPMNEHRFFRVAGPDAQTFLQGQLTCDIEQLAIKQSSYGVHCNAKGRMISSFLITREAGDSFLFRARSDLYEIATAALKKYIIFSKATLEEAKNIISLALLGEHKDCAPAQNITRDALSSNAPSNDYIELIYDIGHIAEQKNNFSLCSLANEEARKVEQIKAGIAEVSSASSEVFLPQELNFDRIEAVSFKKGCYTGQEVVARLHYRGKMKKHMRLGTLATPDIVAGDKIEDAESSKTCGEVIESACANQVNSYFLALIDDTSVQKNTSVTGLKSVANIQWLSLPYAIT